MIKAIKIFFGSIEPVDHSETDKMVANAVANSKITVKKIEALNIHLEKSQTYFIAKALGHIH